LVLKRRPLYADKQLSYYAIFLYIDTLILHKINWNKIYITTNLFSVKVARSDPLITGHFGSMLSKHTKLTVHKKIATFLDKYWVLDKIVKNNNNIQNSKHKNPCQRRNLNRGYLAPQSNAIPLLHQVS